jgi:L-ascorbate metabolism protein UlaG (beta-lactamase superfamily)
MKAFARMMRTVAVALAIAPGAPASTAGQQRTLDLPAAESATDLGTASIQFVGNATVILRYGGITVLTDPNFIHKGDHVHLGYGLESRRLTEPAIPIERLPTIDFVLLSHYHGDHFDQLVEQKLDRRTPIVTTPDAARRLAGRGFEATFPLATWESMTVTKGQATLTVTSLPARHGPPVVAAALPETMGSLVEFGTRSGGSAGNSASRAAAYRLYVSGDTLVYDELKEIPRRYPDIDLALLHLGGTRVLGILVTMDAEQGLEALRLIDAALSVPIHYDDYDVFESPLGDFQQAVREAGLEDRVKYLARGDTYTFSVDAAVH